MEELLRALVQIPSPTGQEAALATYCEQYLQRLGFQTRRQAVGAERFNLLAEKGEGPWSLLLYAHLDTVPASSGWRHDPHQLTRDGDRLQGLGASDMKGGLAVLLQAVSQVQPQGYRLKLALGVDEEAWSQGAWQLVQSDFCHDLAGVLVPELSVDSEHEVLGLGRFGHVALNLNCYGTPQHAALPQTELSAVERASQVVLALKDFPLLQDPEQGRERLVVRKIQAEATGLTVPDLCALELSCFTLPEHPEDRILAELEAFLAPYPHCELSLALRPTPAPAGYHVAAETPFVRWIQQVIQKQTGQALPEVFGRSAADENVLAQQLGLPVLSLAPVGGRSHQARDWVSLQSLERVAALYREILASAGDLGA